jgi:adenylate cyclase class 2
MNQILQKLGFHPEQIYEKWRETLILDQTWFFLDTMPYGAFLEIEGSEKDIRTYAANLDLNWHRRILLNYLEIFEIVRQKQSLKFKDLTFKNFENVRVDMTALLAKLEAGDS